MAREPRWITCLAVEGAKIYTDNRHGGISAREMGERERERWARGETEVSESMLQPHFNFYLIKLSSSMASRFFASLPCPSIPNLHNLTFDHTGKTQM